MSRVRLGHIRKVKIWFEGKPATFDAGALTRAAAAADEAHQREKPLPDPHVHHKWIELPDGRRVCRLCGREEMKP